MELRKHAVIGLSGGMDSASLLVSLIAQGDYEHFHCYGFDYGQRHEIELERAKELATSLKDKGISINYQIINLRDVFSDSQSALAVNSLEVPKDNYSLEVSKQTVVENRNVIFSAVIFSKALAISKKYDVDVDITIGAHSGDHQGVYLDCRPESIEMSKNLYKISNWGSERIDYVAPFVDLSKTEVLGRGLEGLAALGIPYDEYFSMTSSCYDPIDYHGVSYSCGLCATCRDRLEAFEKYGLTDPIPYTGQYKQLRASEAAEDLAS